MKFSFYKMHGASNDFILIDDRTLAFPVTDTAWIARIAARRTGVGCEGILLIQPSANADFRMRFFNPDGSEVDMCGNGARCIARLAHELGVAPAHMSFETPAGRIQADIEQNCVRLQMTMPRDWRLNRHLKMKDGERAYGFVNSGVPHVVMPVKNLETWNVIQAGAEIRHHSDFAPQGTNANFIEITGPDRLRVRTYERGVEGETLACGTGMVACGLIAGKMGWVKPPVKITCASGDELVVDFVLTAEGADQVTLLGPAEQVFQGVLDYPGPTSG